MSTRTSNRQRGSRRKERKDDGASTSTCAPAFDTETADYASPQRCPDRPPRGLKGREIGLWYRDRKRANKGNANNKEKKVKESAESRKVRQLGVTIPLVMSTSKQLEIRHILDKISMSAPPEVNIIRGTGAVKEMYKHIEESNFKRRFLKSITGSLEGNVTNSTRSCLRRDEQLDRKYKEELYKKRDLPQYRNMMGFRRKLPAYEKRWAIIDLVNGNQVMLVSGETGCGKTTQVAQFILDKEIEEDKGSITYIVATQPRRISAISVAERVADERAEPLGTSVGFQIRLEKNMPRSSGAILFCTTGVLLQYMQSDPALYRFSHIILDEIHERDTTSDFLLTILKDIVPIRSDLKVILMSATLDAHQFSKYFNNCPTLNIPGFTFPVDQYYLEDVLQKLRFVIKPDNKRPVNKRRRKEYDQQIADFFEPYIRNMKRLGRYSDDVLSSLVNADRQEINLDLIFELVLYICIYEPEGAILVFLPGWDKISKLNKMITQSRHFPDHRYIIIPLHSMMPSVAQKSAFARPPLGVRKIVLATNIAETSITIDDVVYVIDCGKIKMKNYDIENNVCTLQEEWVSLANAKQRKGRAGRVQKGICYHLFSRPRENLLESYQLPEMLRTRLEEVILQAKVLQVGLIAPFLQKVMNPPDPRAVDISIKLLKSMKALDEEERLTPLGYHLAHLPMDPQAGKMILFAAMFSCLDPITTIASSLSFKDAFVVPLGKEREVDKIKLELAKGVRSDHLLMAQVMCEWEYAEMKRVGWQFTRKNFLSHNTLELLRDMKSQFADHLYYMDFLSSRSVNAEDSNIHSNNLALLKAIICAGLYPNVSIIKNIKITKNAEKAIIKLVTPEDGNVKLHPKSVLEQAKEFESRFLVYHEKLKSSAIYLHDATMVYPLALIFFCHNFRLEDSNDREYQKIIVINDYIKFTCSESLASLIQELRAWLDWLLEIKVSNPGVTDWSENSDEGHILKAIIELISIEYNMYAPEEEGSCNEGSDWSDPGC